MRPINRPVTLNTIHRNHNNISDKGAHWPMMNSSTKASNVLQLISVYPYSAMRQCVFRLSETRLCALVVVSQSAGEVVEPSCVTMRWEIATTWNDPTSPALLAQNAEDTAPTTYVVTCFHRVLTQAKRHEDYSVSYLARMINSLALKLGY